MFRLVEAGFASAGKPDHRDRAPSGFLHFRTADTLRRECRDLGLQIVTHEIELVLVTLFGGMNRRFRRRQREDEPSVASVHRGESENVPEEGTVGLRILAVDDDVRTKNHEPPPSSPMISEVMKNRTFGFAGATPHPFPLPAGEGRGEGPLCSGAAAHHSPSLRNSPPRRNSRPVAN